MVTNVRSCPVCNKPLKQIRVYTGKTWVHMDEGKCCDLCLQPMKLIRLGANKFPIWVHTGSELEKCKGLRLTYNFAKTVTKRLADFKRRLRFEYVGDRIRRYRED